MDHKEAIADQHMRDWFAEDPARADKFSIGLNDFLIDYSKHRITDVTLELLMDLAGSAGIMERIQSMFAGQRINISEDRAALHGSLQT